MRPQTEKFTATSATHDLAQAVNSNHYNNVRAYFNGQRIEKVGSSPSDAFQYTVPDNGGTTRVTLGAALQSGDILIVDYISG